MVGSILFVLIFSKSADYLGIFWGIIWELFGNSLEHVGLSVLLHAWNYCLNIVMTQNLDMRRY